jgi:DNA-binding NarL/FixJ family response regulator
MPKARVLIADDHQIVAAGLQRLLTPQFDVVGVVSDGHKLLDEARRLRPDVVVQDLTMPPLNGIDLIRDVREIDPSIKVVVITMWEDPERAAQAFRAGASAYVLKHCAASELVDAVQYAIAHQSYVTPLIAGAMIDSLSKPARDPADPQLTERQLQVLALLAEGKSMKEVAAVLNLTARTVAFHKYRIMQLLNIKNSADLIRFAIVNGIA